VGDLMVEQDVNHQRSRGSVQVVQKDLASSVAGLVVGPLFSQFARNSVVEVVVVVAIVDDDDWS